MAANSFAESRAVVAPDWTVDAIVLAVDTTVSVKEVPLPEPSVEPPPLRLVGRYD